MSGETMEVVYSIRRFDPGRDSAPRWQEFRVAAAPGMTVLDGLWRIKETANGLWSYSYRGAAERNWKELLGWIARCRLDPMIKVGRMVRNYLWGILNAIMLKTTNAIAESINATIQKIKYRACGFRNRARFRTAILFHKGGLSLLPSGVSDS